MGERMTQLSEFSKRHSHSFRLIKTLLWFRRKSEIKYASMIYGYIRVSTDKQTVENQRFEINRFCERHDGGAAFVIDICLEVAPVVSFFRIESYI